MKKVFVNDRTVIAAMDLDEWNQLVALAGVNYIVADEGDYFDFQLATNKLRAVLFRAEQLMKHLGELKEGLSDTAKKIQTHTEEHPT